MPQRPASAPTLPINATCFIRLKTKFARPCCCCHETAVPKLQPVHAPTTLATSATAKKKLYTSWGRIYMKKIQLSQEKLFRPDGSKQYYPRILHKKKEILCCFGSFTSAAQLALSHLTRPLRLTPKMLLPLHAQLQDEEDKSKQATKKRRASTTIWNVNIKFLHTIASTDFEGGSTPPCRQTGRQTGSVWEKASSEDQKLTGITVCRHRNNIRKFCKQNSNNLHRPISKLFHYVPIICMGILKRHISPSLPTSSSCTFFICFAHTGPVRTCTAALCLSLLWTA